MIFYDKNFNQATKFFETDLNFGLEEKKNNRASKKIWFEFNTREKKIKLAKKIFIAV